MSLIFIRDTIRSLQRDYGTNDITLTKYTANGSIDYTTATPNLSVNSLTNVKGIALPKSLVVDFLKKSLITIDKKSREFLINDARCTADWVKEGNYLTFEGERYNIKRGESVEKYYYFVLATAIGDEAAENQQSSDSQNLNIGQSVVVTN